MTKEKYLFEWLDEWLSAYAKHRVSSNTYDNYVWAVRKIKEIQEDVLLIDFLEIDAQNTLNKMALMGFAKSSIDKVRIVLRQSYNKAVCNHFALENPCENLFIPCYAKTKEILPLTPSEQRAIEMACYEDFNGHLILFLLYTGLRRSELECLEWPDYDENGKRIYVRKSKTKSGVRAVPLLPICQAIIALQPRINKYIFNSRFGTPVTDSVLKKTYLRIRRVTGVETLTNHVCRHTFATRLLECGAEPKAIAALLGHKNSVFTLNRYTAAQDEHLKAQIQLLDSGNSFCNF